MNERKTHTIVFVVNIVSFNNHHVKIGNVTYDIPKPSILADQASFVTSMTSLVPYQKQILAGIP
jgi:hypothetical protein